MRDYYNKHQIITQISLSNKEIKIYPTKGTAQGNVWSPMLWNTVVNSVGAIMEKHDIEGCIFADDIVIAASNQNLEKASSTIQKLLSEI